MKTKENWFPGLIVAPNAQDIVKINTKVSYTQKTYIIINASSAFLCVQRGVCVVEIYWLQEMRQLSIMYFYGRE